MALKYQPTRFTTKFALCGLVLLIISTCRAQQSEKKNLTARFYRHLESVKHFRCQAPQPRTIKVQELIGDELKTSEIVNPHLTILHRCDKGTGYCGKPEQECTVAKIEEVQLVFFVTDTVLKTSGGYKEFTFKNHTECSCQTIGNTIK